MHPLISRVVHIGTIFAAEIGDTSSICGGVGDAGSSSGYAGGAGALRAVRMLRARHGVFARPLGSVVYLMVPPTTDRRRCAVLLGALLDVLDSIHGDLTSSAHTGQGQKGDEEGCIV